MACTVHKYYCLFLMSFFSVCGINKVLVLSCLVLSCLVLSTVRGSSFSCIVYLEANSTICHSEDFDISSQPSFNKKPL